MTKNYDSIDLMKFIACIMVVAIHSDPLQDISPLANRLVSGGLCRLAVPLFFLATAFFLFRNGELTKDKTIKYIKRISLLYACWFLISLPITALNRFSFNADSALLESVQFVKNFFFTSTFSGSWFLMSGVFCTILFYLVQKAGRWSDLIIVVLSIAVYLFCTITSSWGNLMDEFGLREYYNTMVFYFAKPYTSILVGVPYFAIGRYIARTESLAKTPSILLAVALVCMLLVEIYYTFTNKLTNSTDCYFMLLPCAYCIFLYFLKWDISLSNASSLRKSSTIVFFSQFIWLFIIEFVEYLFKITIPQIVKSVSALALCLVTSWIVINMQSYRRFEWLKYIY